ncbi:MAG: caspase family protein [Alphaproteobacteria bacterium]
MRRVAMRRVWSIGLLAAVVWPLAADADITVQVRATDSPDAPVAEEVRLYDASHALVIGMDNYVAGWPKLKNGVNDARLVAADLETHGFEVIFEQDLDAERLRVVLKEFFVLKGADANARLLVWFAGHGQSVHGEGFLVPVDAPPPGDPAFALYALPLRDLGTLVRLARSKHVLAIFDSCFSGTIFEARAGAPPAAITQATLQPVREFLSSGDSDQTVADNGSFRELFLRALRGEDRADANGDGYLTGSELGSFLADRITNLTQGAQTPRFGKLLDVNYDRGDFVFILPQATVVNATSVTVAPDASVEVTFWTSIKDSAKATDFQAYLDQFPDGAFAGLARNRLDELTSPRAPEAGDPGQPMALDRADPPVIDACDKYAAHPLDPARVVRGVAFDGINGVKAIAACEAAVAAYPTATRFQFQLGRALARERRDDEAVVWYRKAADGGHLAAMAGLGRSYQTGTGVAQDNALGAAWMRKAAEAGYLAAQYELGRAYESGLGVDQDGVEAMTWYEAAARAGNGDAQLRMADLLASGLLGATDPVAALTWYNLAMGRLDSSQRQSAAERRQALLDTLSPEDIAAAERDAAAWQPTVTMATP